MKPVVLAILDGWGYSKQKLGNAILNAQTPNLDSIQQNYPSLLLQASGRAAGMAWGESGNSEVGHLTLGAGRIIFQYLSKINKAIGDESFFSNEALTGATKHVQDNNSALHLVGLLTSGSVHAYMGHLFALIDLAKRNNISNLQIHLFTDGKDSGLNEAPKSLKKLEEYLTQTGIGRVSSIIGRDFAMDRGKNWNMTKAAYDLLANGIGEKTRDIYSKLDEYYTQDIADSQIPPTTIGDGQPIKSGDALIFFNFREDSMRQIVQPFVDSDFKIFPKKELTNIYVASLTQYLNNPELHAVFSIPEIRNGLSEVLSKNNKRHLHIAETEKYAHATYFFSCLIDESLLGETDIFVESVKNPSKNPEMKAEEIVDKAIEELDQYDFIILNFANADILSHLGNLETVIKGIEAIDVAVGKLRAAVLEKNGILIITADHGNAEALTYKATGEMETKHNDNPVPFYLIGKSYERPRSQEEIESKMSEASGLLSDVAPTILELMSIPKPEEMSGESLLPIL